MEVPFKCKYCWLSHWDKTEIDCVGKTSRRQFPIKITFPDFFLHIIRALNYFYGNSLHDLPKSLRGIPTIFFASFSITLSKLDIVKLNRKRTKDKRVRRSDNGLTLLIVMDGIWIISEKSELLPSLPLVGMWQESRYRRLDLRSLQPPKRGNNKERDNWNLFYTANNIPCAPFFSEAGRRCRWGWASPITKM